MRILEHSIWRTCQREKRIQTVPNKGMHRSKTSQGYSRITSSTTWITHAPRVPHRASIYPFQLQRVHRNNDPKPTTKFSQPRRRHHHKISLQHHSPGSNGSRSYQNPRSSLWQCKPSPKLQVTPSWIQLTKYHQLSWLSLPRISKKGDPPPPPSLTPL